MIVSQVRQFRRKSRKSPEAQSQLIGGAEAHVPDTMEALVRLVIEASNQSTAVRTEALLHWHATLE